MRILTAILFCSTLFTCQLMANEPCFALNVCDATAALDSFRGLPEGSFEGNSGAFGSINLEVGTPYCGVGLQAGGSYGWYNWDGRAFPLSVTNKVLQQGFVTGGITRQASCSGINFGVVYDWMFTKQFGVFSLDPSISQVRAQVGYLFDRCNEVGIWGTVNANTTHKVAEEIPLTFRAVCQANLFWCHYFDNCAYTMIWAGVPYKRGLLFSSGSSGSYIVGARFRAPLSARWSVEGHGVYMGARRTPDGNSSRNYASDVSIGITYSFGPVGSARHAYMPVADNSNFLTDTNLNF